MIRVKEFLKSSKEYTTEVSLCGALKKHCSAFGFSPEKLNLRKILLDDYYILVIGDSVAWGQGLEENQKYYAIVEKYIKARSNNMDVHKAILAHSGATIGIDDDAKKTSLFSEIPSSYPTIFQQCNGFTGMTKCIDLVLVIGGINDINVRTILNPFRPDSELVDLINRYCNKDMKVLLTNIVRTYSNASVILSGYYPLVGEESDLLLLGLLLIAVGILVGGPAGGGGGMILDIFGKEALVRRSQIFASESTNHFKQAVDEVNASITSRLPHISLAIPNFATKNLVFTSDPWIFGINSDLSAQDSMAITRSVECDRAGLPALDVVTCKIASIGHPNSKGAMEYARVIIPLV